MKMYIAVHTDVPDHMVPVLVAHSAIAAHINFQDNADYNDWLLNSFRKVVLRVNKKEFEKLSEMEDIHLGHENTVMNAEKSCVIICPRKEYPNVIKYAKMWKPKYE